MPIPKPNEGESSEDFFQRCISDETMVNEYPDSEQRYAICQNQKEMKDVIESIKFILGNIKDKK